MLECGSFFSVPSVRRKPLTLRPQSLRELRVERLLGTEVTENFSLAAAQAAPAKLRVGARPGWTSVFAGVTLLDSERFLRRRHSRVGGNPRAKPFSPPQAS